jgi:glutathione synthase/RimK-type ligase-like ATP-grasp enzyme
VEQALSEVSGDIVVVKEPHEYVDGVVSNGGKFVYIGDRKTVLQQLPERYPLLVQEFVDSSIGIDELANGVHDMRVEIGGGTIWGGSLRTPAPGELRANLAQGGTRRRLSAEEIPPEVRQLALEIDTFFERYPRYYSLDFAHTTLGWKLFELNSNPGLVPASQSPQAQQIMKQLATYLIQECPELR